ncbi:hypothetical protein JCM14036_12510 [Desulfotomaculum defluvii]
MSKAKARKIFCDLKGCTPLEQKIFLAALDAMRDFGCRRPTAFNGKTLEGGMTDEGAKPPDPKIGAGGWGAGVE